VSVVRPERHTVRRSIEQPGHVEAYEQTAVFAKIAGYVLKVYVDIGDKVVGPEYDARDPNKKVKEGQRLADLWVPEMAAEVLQKEALVAKAAEEINQAREIVKVAAANRDSARARVKEAEAGKIRAQADYERWRVEYQKSERLLKQGTLDEQTRDVTLNQFRAADAVRAEVAAKVLSAEAVVKESEAQWNKAQADVKVAEARHKAAQADHVYARTLLDYARIEAPYSGIITWRNVNTGDLLSPTASSGSKSEPLFVVARFDKVRIFINVPETDAVLVNKDAKVRLQVRALRGQEFEGVVARSTWALDPKARTLRTEIDVPNREGPLRPGMYANAVLTVERPNVWTLPAAAVVVSDEQPYCFRHENGKAVRTPVQIGIQDGQRIEVLKKQTASAGTAWEDWRGDEAILSSAASLTPGQTVTPGATH
jgi:RND family efflux transporter MFP subunit